MSGNPPQTLRYSNATPSSSIDMAGFAYSTHVLTATGNQVPIGNVGPGDLVISGRGTPREVAEVIDQGPMPAFCVQTRSGRELIAGMDQQFLTEAAGIQTWQPLTALRKGANLLAVIGDPYRSVPDTIASVSPAGATPILCLKFWSDEGFIANEIIIGTGPAILR